MKNIELIPYFKKGTKAFCLNCKEHLFTIARDVFLGEQTHETMFCDGQNFKCGDFQECKKCGKKFSFSHHHLRIVENNE